MLLCALLGIEENIQHNHFLILCSISGTILISKVIIETVPFYSLVTKTYGLVKKNQAFMSNIEEDMITLVISWRPF